MTKGPNAFRTISEAADEIGVQQHVLRFWETKFAFIRPMKRAGGRRFYRPQDIVVLKGVKALLYDQGYKIEGVQKLHREKGVKRVAWAADPDAAAEFEDAALSAAPLNGASVLAEHAPVTDPAARRRLQRALEELEAAKAKLDAVLRG